MPYIMLYLNSTLAAGLLSVLTICLTNLTVPLEAKILIGVPFVYLALLSIGLAEALERISRTDRFLVGLVEHVNQTSPREGLSVYDRIKANIERESSERLSLRTKMLWISFVVGNTTLLVFFWRGAYA